MFAVCGFVNSVGLRNSLCLLCDLFWFVLYGRATYKFWFVLLCALLVLYVL